MPKPPLDFALAPCFSFETIIWCRTCDVDPQFAASGGLVPGQMAIQQPWHHEHCGSSFRNACPHCSYCSRDQHPKCSGGPLSKTWLLTHHLIVPRPYPSTAAVSLHISNSKRQLRSPEILLGCILSISLYACVLASKYMYCFPKNSSSTVRLNSRAS